MTYRRARRTLGSRTRRRANTNGKRSGRTGKGGRSILRRLPRRVSRIVAVTVKRLMKGAL